MLERLMPSEVLAAESRIRRMLAGESLPKLYGYEDCTPVDQAWRMVELCFLRDLKTLAYEYLAIKSKELAK